MCVIGKPRKRGPCPGIGSKRHRAQVKTIISEMEYKMSAHNTLLGFEFPEIRPGEIGAFVREGMKLPLCIYREELLHFKVQIAFVQCAYGFTRRLTTRNPVLFKRISYLERLANRFESLRSSTSPYTLCIPARPPL